jgi:hypothetical protein
MGGGQVGVGHQSSGKVLQRARKIMAVLPELAPDQKQRGRQRCRKASDHCVGVAHVAGISTSQGKIKVGFGEARGNYRIACRGGRLRAQARYFA